MSMEFTIGSVDNISFSNIAAKKALPKEKDNLFENFYNAALNVINETNNYQKAADKAQNDYVTGKTDDVLSVMMAQEKAYSTLNFTLQVTTKAVEAYREIMRMQI